jgi:hypothetical protein
VQGIVLRCSSDNVGWVVYPVTYKKSEYYAPVGGLEKVSGTLNPVTGTLLACGIVIAVKVPLC